MKVVATHISYQSTRSFQSIVNDYLHTDAFLQNFIETFPSEEAIKWQIEKKQSQSIDRELLYRTLQKQYQKLPTNEFVNQQIEKLQLQNAFTICTAHQPNIFTGYLYFIYKIIHAIKLATSCATIYPDYHFIPVFYIGSEDNDMDEIGEFNYQQKHYRLHTNQQGACGRMHTRELQVMAEEIVATLNAEIEDEKALIALLREAYNGSHTLSEATRILLHNLFGKYGLLVLDADDADCKQAFRTVMHEELFKQSSKMIVDETLQQLSTRYKVQAQPRDINLFYLMDNLRARIEKKGDVWQVLNTNYSFTKSELETELQQYPERFSPNVILRPLYQETLLPNVAVIGGGGELAYWLQLKSLFEKHQLVFPLLFVRNSVLWMNKNTQETRKKLALSLDAMFETKEEIFFNLSETNTALSDLNKLLVLMDENLKKFIELGASNHPQLKKSMEAHASKIRHIEKRMEQKFKSHYKRKSEITWQQIVNLKEQIAPKGHLQERHDNFLTIFKQYGFSMFTILLEHQQAFGKEFLIIHPA
ncbi:MAG: bacillithiol biosynthesis cysteine-adding enzyme BshC [Bacteroidetes bacterium]|nr:bacillithiol biosynthesis cysteine-adding enzyme BshC [Bacteroidota bacterium]